MSGLQGIVGAPRRDGSEGRRPAHEIWRARKRLLLQAVPAGMLIFVLALVLRLAWVLTLGGSLTWIDEEQFVEIARHLSAGDGYVSDSFRANPVLPAYLAIMFRIFGEHYVYPRIGQAILGASTSVLIYRITLLAAGRQAGVIAGILSALYLPHIYLSGVFYVDTVLTFLAAMSVYLAMRALGTGRLALVVGCGIALGLTVLTRGLYLCYVPCLAALLIIHGRKEMLPAALRCAVLVSAAAVVILPWTLRNHAVYGRVILVSSGFGTKLWEGNNPLSWGNADDRVLRWQTHEWTARLAQLPDREQAAIGREYDEVDRQVAERRRAIGDDWLAHDDVLLPIAVRYMIEHPGRTAMLFVKKLRTMYAAFSDTISTNEYTSRRNKLLAGVAFYPVLALAIAGMAMGIRAMEPLGPVLLMIVSVSFAYGMLNTCTRFRLPLDPFLIVLASQPLAWLWGRATGTRQPAPPQTTAEPEAQGVAGRCFRTAVGLLRCEQWVKNAFVFAGLLFGGHFDRPISWGYAIVAFLLFSAVASTAYIHNDLVDREADARHPTKRHRPLAAGTVTPATAYVVQVALLAGGLGTAAVFDLRILSVLFGYLALNLAYSSWLKHQVVIDVMVIAVGFVMRVVVGCMAVGVTPSIWLLLCTFLLALYLGFGKRRHELLVIETGTKGHRQVLDDYGIKFLDQMMVVVSALTITSYIMFTVWPDTVARHGTTNLVYTVPLVLYGLFRYDFLIYRAEQGGSPTDVLLTDRPLLATLVVWAAACVAIIYWK